MLVVYVAGPLHSSGVESDNVRAAISAANRLAEGGIAPIVPHLSVMWHLVHPHAADWWLERDLAILGRCDALLRIPGKSAGADREEAFARDAGIPVYAAEERGRAYDPVSRLLSDVDAGVLRPRAGPEPVDTLIALQEEQRVWQERVYGAAPWWHHVLGMTEELGELSHALLKDAQGIRGTHEEHEAKARDAIGDVLVYMLALCNARGWSLSQILQETAASVFARDRAAFAARDRPPPDNGHAADVLDAIRRDG